MNIPVGAVIKCKDDKDRRELKISLADKGIKTEYADKAGNVKGCWLRVVERENQQLNIMNSIWGDSHDFSFKTINCKGCLFSLRGWSTSKREEHIRSVGTVTKPRYTEIDIGVLTLFAIL